MFWIQIRPCRVVKFFSNSVKLFGAVSNLIWSMKVREATTQKSKQRNASTGIPRDTLNDLKVDNIATTWCHCEKFQTGQCKALVNLPNELEKLI